MIRPDMCFMTSTINRNGFQFLKMIKFVTSNVEMTKNLWSVKMTKVSNIDG